jgi:hypothetical protein
MVSARQGKFKALRGHAIAAAHRSADFRPCFPSGISLPGRQRMVEQQC